MTILPAKHHAPGVQHFYVKSESGHDMPWPSLENPRCSERGCPFPPAPGETLCRQHSEMLSSEESLYEPSIEATEEDVASAIFYDESVSVKKRGIVPLDEWLENKEWGKLLGMADSWKSRERRKRCIASGLCINCGALIASGSVYRKCAGCGSKNITYKRRLRRLRDAAGKCTRCGRNRDRNLKLCSSCGNKIALIDRKRSSLAIRRRSTASTARAAEREAAIRQRRRDAGLCQCGGVRDVANRKECSSCLARHRDRVRRLAAAGICRSCAKAQAITGHSLCAPCRRRKNEWLAARQVSAAMTAAALEDSVTKRMYLVRIGCEQIRVQDASRIAARNRGAAWSVALDSFFNRFPQALERGLSVGGSVKLAK